ncbi:hypothetical protein PSTT_06856 [Puccinia striiformis]|uniref:Uncharacterized protein n=1 Tax=Puccinia striiformis TaxID=27350 RepID=A0A2S4VIV1_9BASI|nr:hypothetical protein PSTT_06856 [Puccinia striiformis]
MLGRLWSIYFVVAHFANARTTGFPATCPRDWSLDPNELVVRCPSVEYETPVKCIPSSCSDFPVCGSCTNVATQERRNKMTCRNGFNMIDTGSSSYAMCFDQDENAFECTDSCEGILSKQLCFSLLKPHTVHLLSDFSNRWDYSACDSCASTRARFECKSFKREPIRWSME